MEEQFKTNEFLENLQNIFFAGNVFDDGADFEADGNAAAAAAAAARCFSL